MSEGACWQPLLQPGNNDCYLVSPGAARWLEHMLAAVCCLIVAAVYAEKVTFGVVCGAVHGPDCMKLV
jgi:hypothetical protein